MPAFQLSEMERKQLLTLARNAIVEYLKSGKESVQLDMGNLSQRLWESGATFVTLTIKGQLRGCIGSLEQTKPLAEDVIEHAIAAASQDYRFPPVMVDELDDIQIEISRLTTPQPLYYENPEDLLSLIQPFTDGVVIIYGVRRATFLPQVWEKIPDPSDFLEHLCIKMGMPPDTWRHEKVEILTYQVEEFHE